MDKMDYSNCQIVGMSLKGQREIDGQTFESLTILKERMDRLKELGGSFSRISLSPDCRRMAEHKNTVAVC